MLLHTGDSISFYKISRGLSEMVVYQGNILAKGAAKCLSRGFRRDFHFCSASCGFWDSVDKAPRLVFILIQYLSNSTKQQILGRQCYLG